MARSKKYSSKNRQRRSPAAMHSAMIVQTKLTVGAANDAAEQEADATANKVMRLPEQSFIQRKCAGCGKEEKIHRKPLIQAKAEGGVSVNNNTANTINASKGKGNAIDSNTQSFMSNRFGSSFSHVKIHTDNEAVQLNRSLHAKAFTVGNDIYFNESQYQPNTAPGKHLLAHELTHTWQQGADIKRAPMPKDAFGRSLGFVPTAEQEQYDKDTYEIKEWEKVLARLKNGELDDNDMQNWRLMNKLTGFVTSDVTALITKIKDYQSKNKSISTTKIIEWLEVRKDISTPMPAGATVNKDPLTQTIDSYSLTVNNVKITVLADKFATGGNETGPASNFGRNYSWHASKNIIDRLTNTTGGGAVAVNPTSFEVTIQTTYGQDANGQSGYGKGTDAYDKEEGTTTLRSHEGKHGTDFINYISKHPFPADISKGIVGVLTVAQMRSIDAYISGMVKESCEATDEVGYTQDEFLKTDEGKRSGIPNCRKQ